MISEELLLNQANLITFVLVDATYTEVPGIGNAFTLEISKAGGAFVASTGVKAEISDGWYSYALTAAECDTIGPLSVIAYHATTIQQNLEYVVVQRTSGCHIFPYVLTSSVLPNPPIAGATVWFSTDAAGTNIVWTGTTDAFGAARDAGGNVPCLDPGPYFVWSQKEGWTPDAWPDIEVVP